MLCDQLFQQARGCGIEAAVGIFPNFVRDTPPQQIGAEGLWRLRFERCTPACTKLNDRHPSKPIELSLERCAHIVRRRRDGSRIQGPALIRERIHEPETNDTDALFAPGCQSFLGNIVAGFRRSGAVPTN